MQAIKRQHLAEALREAIEELGLSQGELADNISKNTELKVRGTHISRALRDLDNASMDYLREAMAEELFGGSWSRDVFFFQEI